MIDQIYFYLNNVINTSRELAKYVQTEFDPIDKILTFLDNHEKCPDFLKLSMLVCVSPLCA